GSVQIDLGNRLGELFLHQHGNQPLLAAARTGFIEHFANDGQAHVGTWLWRKRAIIAKPIVELLVIPRGQKQALLRVFDYDTSLEALFKRVKAARLLYRSTNPKYDAAKAIAR